MLIEVKRYSKSRQRTDFARSISDWLINYNISRGQEILAVLQRINPIMPNPLNAIKPNPLMSNLMNLIMPNLNVRTMISDKRWHHLQYVLHRNDRILHGDQGGSSIKGLQKETRRNTFYVISSRYSIDHEVHQKMIWYIAVKKHLTFESWKLTYYSMSSDSLKRSRIENVENVKGITLYWMYINEDQEHVIKYVWTVWRSLFVTGEGSIFNYQDKQRTIIPNISDLHKKQKCIYEVHRSPHMHTANTKLWDIMTDTITRGIVSCVMLQFYTLRTWRMWGILWGNHIRGLAQFQVIKSAETETSDSSPKVNLILVITSITTP